MNCKIFACMPRHGYQSVHGADLAFYRYISDPARDLLACEPYSKGHSLLPYSFNEPLAQALRMYYQGQCTHFAMLHSDVEPEPFWLDKLFDLCEQHDSDVMTAVMPLKNHTGVTSTGIGYSDKDGLLRRITMREAMELPETFRAPDFGYPGHPLLPNTGCWIGDLRKPWAHLQDEQGRLRCSFNIESWIYGPQKGFEVTADGEDFRFGYYLASINAKVMATRAVKAWHIGPQRFPNFEAWGSQEHDEETKERWEHAPAL